MARQSGTIDRRIKGYISALTLGITCMASALAADENAAAPSAQGNTDQTQQRAQSELQAAHRHMEAGDDHAAVAAFEHAFSMGVHVAGSLVDAANAAVRLGENELAVQYFEKSLDADTQQRALDDEQRFAVRREVEQLERRWGVVLGAAYQTEAFSAQGTVAALEPSIEAYWQPPVIGYRNQRLLQFFVRAYGSAYDGSGDVTGMPTAQASVGARYKPLVDQNIVLSLERLIRIGRLSVNDWLARASYSTEAGTDLQVAAPSWRSWQAYVDGAYFFKEGRYTFSTELRYGNTWRLPLLNDRLTVYPHIALAGDYDSFDVNRIALGMGPGIGFRFWFREGPYAAPASSLDVTVQYRFPLTAAPRARGLIVRATLAF